MQTLEVAFPLKMCLMGGQLVKLQILPCSGPHSSWQSCRSEMRRSEGKMVKERRRPSGRQGWADWTRAQRACKSRLSWRSLKEDSSTVTISDVQMMVPGRSKKGASRFHVAVV